MRARRAMFTETTERNKCFKNEWQSPPILEFTLFNGKYNNRDAYLSLQPVHRLQYSPSVDAAVTIDH